jgi:crotonobetainyl-CoA:carnitine CoA-transferase CaiB-like acyl-CoA transferase
VTAGGALANLRICDFSGQLAGAGATRLLAAFGADVIRIEDPVRQGRWDILRGSWPYRDERRGINLGGAFNNHNVGKRGVTLDLRTGRGRELARRLAAVSDVVTENFAAGVIDRLGLGYEQLRELRPDIIVVSNSGFGRSGPYAGFKTWGPIVQAVSGLTATSGLPDREPAGWGYSYMDHMGAYYMALAVLTAVVERNRTGRGQHVDMACTETGMTLSGPAVLDAEVNGVPGRRPGQPDANHDETGRMAPHCIYPAAGEDRWVAIACRDDADWQRLAGALDEPWAADPDLAALGRRKEREDELDGLIAEWTAKRTPAEVVDHLRAAGVPVAAVRSPQERIDDDPRSAAWGLWPRVEHPDIGAVRVDGIGMHLSETDWVIERPGPRLGQHNREVLGELLGLTGTELDELEREGVL